MATVAEITTAWKDEALDERRRANAAEAKLVMATAEISLTRAALSSILSAWDSLKPGSYDKDIWETWLLQKMKPAIDAARGAVK